MTEKLILDDLVSLAGDSEWMPQGELERWRSEGPGRIAGTFGTFPAEKLEEWKIKLKQEDRPIAP